MILSFHIKNFKSIVDTVVDMSFAEGKAPNGHKDMSLLPFLDAAKGNRVVPCLGLYGANASGKSNILEALTVFGTIIRERKIHDNYFPNKIQYDNGVTFFEIQFSIGLNIHTYSLWYNNLSIVGEKLKCDNEVLYEISNEVTVEIAVMNKEPRKDPIDIKVEFSSIERESYPKKRLKDIFEVECVDEKGQHSAFLSVLGKNYAGLNKKVESAFNYFSHGILELPSNKVPILTGLNVMQAANYAEEHLKEISAMIRKLDISIKRMEVKREELDSRQLSERTQKANTYHGIVARNKDRYIVDNIYAYHTTLNGGEVRFEFIEESLGTQIATGLLSAVIFSLKSGTVMIVDELDSSLHPLLLVEIIRLFKDKRYNTKGAQLIFTAHNTDILDEIGFIRVSELGIVKKTMKEGTTLTRAVDFGIRGDRNLRKAYLSGELGGIPFPYI